MVLNMILYKTGTFKNKILTPYIFYNISNKIKCNIYQVYIGICIPGLKVYVG